MNFFTSEQRTLFLLLRRSLWGEAVCLPGQVDWQAVDTMANTQGVTSLLYDGAVGIKAEIPGDILQKWKTKMLGGVMRNQRLLAAQDDVCAWLAQAGIPAAVLKGSSIARYYPQPDLRVLGDIDILVREADVERADALLTQKGFTRHESDHAFHLSYSKPGAYVELHYNVTKLPDSPGGRAAGEVIAGFLERAENTALEQHRFPVLSGTDQGLSLLLHMVRHMFEGGIGLRQLCDWAMYVAAADPDSFAADTVPVLKKCGLLRYAAVATRTCVEYLGLPKVTWCEDADEEVCRQFMADIFRGGNMGQADRESLGSLFTDEGDMGRRSSSMKVLFSTLTQVAYDKFPITQKYKLLLPIFWVFLTVRYVIRSVLRQRPDTARSVILAWRRRKLYDGLKMFEIQP